MIVYIFDGYTGEYLREYTPQKNPKSPKEYLFPRFSTTIKPNIKDGFYPVFNGENWVQIPDFRGKEIIYPDGSIDVIKILGALPENTMLFEEYKLTDEYNQKKAQYEREKQKQEIVDQIEFLDKKRIRAICEPSQKDESQTWLEYYTNQITNLRKQLEEI